MSQMVGVVNGEEILSEIVEGRLVTRCVDPASHVRGCSFDLTVGTIFWEGKIIREVVDNPTQVVVPPGGVIGIFTAEELALPNDMFATAFAINEMSSRGFLVLNPGHVDPGFTGALTVKALNVRKTSIAISQGDPIFTVIFQRLAAPTEPFSRNASRADRERRFNAETVQSSPKTIGSMIELDRDGPFPSRGEVKDLIRSDAINRATLYTAVIAAVASIVAVVISLLPEKQSIAQTTRTTHSVEQARAKSVDDSSEGAKRLSKPNSAKEGKN